MAPIINPPFRTDHVGSLLRPLRLAEARQKEHDGLINGSELKAVQDECIIEAVKRQESIGLQAVTDGEFRRDAWQWDFLCGFDGMELRKSNSSPGFRGGYQPDNVYTDAKIANQKGVMVDHFAYLMSVANVTPKICLPSPSMAYHRGGRGSIDPDIYPDIEEFFSDLAVAYSEEIKMLAGLGCSYLQLDDTTYAMMCDETVRQNILDRGDDPDELIGIYGKTIRKAIQDRPSTMRVTVHMCRGNHRSNWIAEGGYELTAEKMFDEVDVDGYFMEWDSERAGSFEPLRFVPDDKFIVLGLITSKTPELEAKDEIKRRIDEAAKYVPLEYLCLSPQCGFASTHLGNKLTEEEQFKKLELVVEVAEEVWG